MPIKTTPRHSSPTIRIPYLPSSTPPSSPPLSFASTLTNYLQNDLANISARILCQVNEGSTTRWRWLFTKNNYGNTGTQFFFLFVNIDILWDVWAVIIGKNVRAKKQILKPKMSLFTYEVKLFFMSSVFIELFQE